MTGRKLITAAALLMLAMSSGCCRWMCEHCGCAAPAPVAGYPAAMPACGCYAPVANYPPTQPIVAPQPANWAQPRQLNGCSCTCPPQ